MGSPRYELMWILPYGEGGGDTHAKSFGDWLVQVAILGSHKASPQAQSAAQDRLDKVYNSRFAGESVQRPA